MRPTNFASSFQLSAPIQPTRVPGAAVVHPCLDKRRHFISPAHKGLSQQLLSLTIVAAGRIFAIRDSQEPNHHGPRLSKDPHGSYTRMAQMALHTAPSIGSSSLYCPTRLVHV